MQSIGGNLLQDLDNHADFDGKRKRSIFATLLRTWRPNGIESIFPISAEKLSIHANVPQKKVGWIRLSLQQ